MAKNHSVALYTLSVVEKKKQINEEQKPLLLSEKFNGKDNFYDFVEKYLSHTTKNMFVDDGEDVYLRVSSSLVSKGKKFCVDGKIESGESGISSKLHHTKTHGERDKLADEADLAPFYYCIRETNDPTQVALCVQRLGHQGIKTQLVKSLQKYFREMFPGHMLLVSDHLPTFYKNKFFQTRRVKKLEYTYIVDVGDVSSQLEADGKRELGAGQAIVKFSVQPTKGFVHKIRNVLNSDLGEALASFKPKGLNLDDSKRVDTSVTLVDRDGKSRTFRMAQNRDILPYIDVTNHVGIKDGHPVLEDMREAVTDILVNAKLIDRDGEN